MLYSYRTKLIAFIKFCFFSLFFLISFCIKSGPEQQIEHDVLSESTNLFTEQDRWIFKKLDQGLVPANIGDREVLLIIDPSFLMNDDQYSELSPDTNTNIESYIALSIIRMLEKEEVKQEFINLDDAFIFSKEGFDLLEKIDKVLYPLLEAETSDIYVDASFEKNILKYAAIATFTFDGVTPICEIRYNHQETKQSKKKSYPNKYDVTSDTKNSICPEINYINTELAKKEIGNEEIANLCPLNKYSHENAESLSENTHSALSLKPQKSTKKRIRKLYDCKVCGKNGLANIKKHMFTHTRKSDFNCSKCSKALATKYELTRHMDTHTKDRHFSCDKCSKRFRYKQSLTIHELSHIDNHAFKCKKCNYACTSPYFLREHNHRMHDLEYTHICHLCSKQHMYESELQQHLITHKQEKNFMCHLCTSTFKTKQTLQRHIDTHAKERHYACSTCNNRFTTKRSLQRHICKFHKVATESCVPDM